jgi:DNA-binding NtrC family response regulator
MADKFDVPTRTVIVGGRPRAIVFRKYQLKAVDNTDIAPFVGDKRHVVIGSDESCDLTISNKAISRRHCEISIDDRGYLITDLNSKNGTLLDGVRIVAGYLNPGSTIAVGGIRLEFHHEGDSAEEPLWPEAGYGTLVGPSLDMRAMFAVMDKVAAQDVTVIVQGESGTGKELVVREIHNHSNRKDGPLIVVDCSAVPENLVESELFGHVKGAFTGATSDRPGAFRLADGGTLFLDELGEMPLDVQPKLLRALESREVRPVGGNKTYKCDVRVIAATNRDLAEEVKKGSFREDLFFRLNVLRIDVPPLRRRRDDIPALIENFIKAGDSETPPRVPSDVLAMLASHSWPGNVRELKNFVERFKVFAPSDASHAARLLDHGASQADTDVAALFRYDIPFKEAKGQLVGQFEVEYCRRLLERHGGNISAGAREAGIHRKYLEELVRKHALK